MYTKYVKHSLFRKQQMGETSHEFNLSYNRDKKNGFGPSNQRLTYPEIIRCFLPQAYKQKFQFSHALNSRLSHSNISVSLQSRLSYTTKDGATGLCTNLLHLCLGSEYSFPNYAVHHCAVNY